MHHPVFRLNPLSVELGKFWLLRNLRAKISQKYGK